MKNIQTTRVIPRELIKHLEWNPKQESEQPPKDPPRDPIRINKAGKFDSRGTPILVVMHGGGILIPERIEAAYTMGLLNGSAKFQENEFEDLLKGNIYGKSFPLYRIAEVKKGVSSLPHQFGVVMPYKIAQRTNSGYHQKDPFLKNP